MATKKPSLPQRPPVGSRVRTKRPGWQNSHDGEVVDHRGTHGIELRMDDSEFHQKTIIVTADQIELLPRGKGKGGGE